MNLLNSMLILAAAFLAVFFEAAFPGLRYWLGAQIDLLPALMVCAALATDIVTLSLLAVLGGLWFDVLSANPLGVTILPLFAAGFLIYLQRDLILHELPFAQLILGGVASGVVPVLTGLLMLSGGKHPLIGWSSVWQWIVMTAGGAVVTPGLFALLAWCQHAFGYQPRMETSFRPDREIQRGREVKGE